MGAPPVPPTGPFKLLPLFAEDGGVGGGPCAKMVKLPMVKNARMMIIFFMAFFVLVV